MTLVLIEQGLVLEGSTTKIEDKQVPGIYIYMAAAQNVRSGSSPGPTNDPDL